MSSAPDLEARLAAMEARLTALEDERAIREILSRYGYLADMGLFEAYVTLFTGDGVMDAGAGDTVFRWQGHDALLEFISGPGHRAQLENGCLHLQGNNVRVQVTGDDAVAEGYSMLLNHDANGQVFVRAARISRWTMRRVRGEWKIAERRVRQLSEPGAREVLVTRA